MIKTGLVRRLKKITALPDERVQLQIAKIISNLSAFGMFALKSLGFFFSTFHQSLQSPPQKI